MLNKVKEEIFDIINNKIYKEKDLTDILNYCLSLIEKEKNNFKEEKNTNHTPRFNVNDIIRIIDKDSVFYQKIGKIIDYDLNAKFSISYVIQINNQIIKFKEWQIKKEGC